MNERGFMILMGVMWLITAIGCSISGCKDITYYTLILISQLWIIASYFKEK